MKFYTGMFHPHTADKVERAFVSVNVLKKRKSAFPVKDWIMDSGAFTTINKYGGYPEPVSEYAKQIKRWKGNGNLIAAVSQDYMCEAWMLEKTGLTVADHQRLTVERYDQLVAEDTGVCIMQMDAGLDTGAVLMQDSLPISDTDTSASLLDKLAALGSRLIVDTLSALPQLQEKVQATEGVTYAAKILKDEALIDWRLPALRLSQRIRAFDPFPGAHTVCQGQVLKIWSASAVVSATHATPGSVVQLHADAFDVATGDGVLRVTQVQRPGGKRISAAEFLHSHALSNGMLLGASAD